MDLHVPPPPGPAEPPGFHRHDGFYARLGLGFSAFGDTLVPEDEAAEDRGGHHNSVSGFATVSEIALGGTPATGFVVGGGIFSVSVVTTSVNQVAGEVLPDELAHPENFAVVGPFFDWYFYPRRGLHVEGALGLAAVSGLQPERARFEDRNVALGLGAVAGIGYEWWVGDDWGLGILGRMSGGVAGEETDANVRWLHFVGASPSVLFSATYH